MAAGRTAIPSEPAHRSDPVIDQTTLRSYIGYNMKRAYLAVRADFITSLAHLDLSPSQFSALAIVVDNPGVSQSALARALSVERSGLVGLINSLEVRGLVTRDPVPGDRRSHALRASPAGMRHHAEALAAMERHEARMSSRLTRSERAELVRLLNRIEACTGQPPE